MERKKFSLVSLLKKLIKLFFMTLYVILIVGLSFGTASASIITILPAEASKVNHLGYYSTCSFAPYSTIILFSLAILGFILLIKFVKRLVRQSKKSVLYLGRETVITQN